MLREGDVFIFDRGFRDCLADLEGRGYVTKTPEFVLKKQPNGQLTTAQANRSRLVTKTRFVVETRNGHLKTVWPIFNRIWPTMHVPHLMLDLRIAAALLNKFFASIVADKENEEQVANAMLARLNTVNFVNEVVQEFSAEDLAAFGLIDENNFQFPRIDKDELSQITLGSYQLKQAKSYAYAHKKAKLDQYEVPYACFVLSDEVTQRAFANIIANRQIEKPVLVRTQMDSRFRSSKWHDSYILADADKNGPDAIIGYCCECQHGLRTIGCCSHIATTIYYLCFARHHDGIKPIAAHLEDFFQNYSVVVEADTTSGDESE